MKAYNISVLILYSKFTKESSQTDGF